MSSPLQELFKPEAMGPLVQRFAEQSADRNFIAVYEEGQKILANIDGSFAYDEVRFSRDLAPIAGLDAQTESAAKMGRTKRTGSVVAIKEHVDLPARFLDAWNAPGKTVPDAAAVIAMELRNLTNRVQRTRNYWAAKSLLTQGGAVDLKDVPNSKLASWPLVYPVLDIDASASWATAATKIRSSELPRLKKTYQLASGMKAARILGSSDLEKHLLANDEISDIFNGSGLAGQILASNYDSQMAAGGINYGDLRWKFCHDHYATDAAPDTTVEVNADLDVFAILPDASMSPECFAIAEGVTYAPVGPIAGDLAAAPENLFRQIRGFGAYVTLETKPVGIRLHVVWSGMLVQKVQKAVGVFDASPA
jgi:hypothetical protein